MTKIAALPQVTVYTDCDLVHTSFVFAGLIELADAARIELNFKLQRRAWSKYRGRFTVLLQVRNPKNQMVRTGCVDVHDVSSYFSLDSLEECDLYSKSNYQGSMLASLRPELAERVRPLGLYFGCKSAKDRGVAKRHLGSIASMLAKLGGSTKKRSQYEGAYRLYAVALKRLGRYNRLLNVASYENDCPTGSVDDKIYFQTRLFPEKDQATREMNHRRAELVRKMKREFGSRFIGGLIPSAESIGEFSDCLSRLDSSLDAHIRRVRSSLICVYSNGLDNSFAWKLPEYMAAAKCIVSEEWQNELPDSPVADRDIFFFKSPDECVDHCARLMSDRSSSEQARENISNFYRQHVRPNVRMWRIVESLTA